MYGLFRPLIFALDAETAHKAALSALGLPWPDRGAIDPVLRQRIAGLDFAGPVGLAAGFDKDGVAAQGMRRFGFAFGEIGTLTPLPQPGNPRPRLFRLAEDPPPSSTAWGSTMGARRRHWRGSRRADGARTMCSASTSAPTRRRRIASRTMRRA